MTKLIESEWIIEHTLPQEEWIYLLCKRIREMEKEFLIEELHIYPGELKWKVVRRALFEEKK